MSFYEKQTKPDFGQSVLTLQGVAFAYPQHQVLQDINLRIRAGEFLTLLGPSGSGKTTLLRLIAGLENTGGGSIRLDQRAITGPGTDRAMVFQDYSLFPWMSLIENTGLAVSKVNPHLNAKERRALAREYLELVGLGGAADKYPYQLSGGMQQRGAIARSLALGSPYLLMDEPFGALDPINRMKLQDLLLNITKNTAPPKTVIFVTHDLDEALYLGDRVAVLGSSPGRIIAEFPVNSPRPRHRDAFFAGFETKQLREEILSIYRLDALTQLEGEEKTAGYGGGI